VFGAEFGNGNAECGIGGVEHAAADALDALDTSAASAACRSASPGSGLFTTLCGSDFPAKTDRTRRRNQP
jgi:hypothetical protein